MNTALLKSTEAAPPLLTKRDATTPALIVTGKRSLAIKAGTAFAGRLFADETPIAMPETGLDPGADYVVALSGGEPCAGKLTGVPTDGYLGGFHVAPGGNASGRSGGDGEPAINPSSLWDLAFRPACPDPRGMTLVEGPRGLFWCDIYLLGVNHLAHGTSTCGATIADGDDPPANPAGGYFKRLDYATALAVMKHHGKGLLGVEEFFAAAFGVTERSATGKDPRVTGLDAPRTSRFGLMQATGNLWVWGHDGDPELPRASLFGGSWLSAGDAGSRYAIVAFHWPADSSGNVGARGRGDHLQLA